MGRLPAIWLTCVFLAKAEVCLTGRKGPLSGNRESQGTDMDSSLGMCGLSIRGALRGVAQAVAGRSNCHLMVAVWLGLVMLGVTETAARNAGERVDLDGREQHTGEWRDHPRSLWESWSPLPRKHSGEPPTSQPHGLIRMAICGFLAAMAANDEFFLAILMTSGSSTLPLGNGHGWVVATLGSQGSGARLESMVIWERRRLRMCRLAAMALSGGRITRAIYGSLADGDASRRIRAAMSLIAITTTSGSSIQQRRNGPGRAVAVRLAQAGVYGSQGAEAGTNVPGARAYPVSWTDNTGNFWLLGGHGYDENGDVRPTQRSLEIRFVKGRMDLDGWEQNDCRRWNIRNISDTRIGHRSGCSRIRRWLGRSPRKLVAFWRRGIGRCQPAWLSE